MCWNTVLSEYVGVLACFALFALEKYADARPR